MAAAPERVTAIPPPALSEFAHHRRWVAWRPDKTPVDPHTGRAARVSDPATWGTHEEAAARAERDGLPGVGIVLGDLPELGGPLGGVDFDDCIDDAGSLSPWVAAWLENSLESYAEVSPSGRGVKVFGRMTSPTRGVAVKGERLPEAVRSHGVGGVEVYSRGRYFTVTGDTVPGTPSVLAPIDPAVSVLLGQIRPARPADTDPGEFWFSRYVAEASPGDRNNTGHRLALQLHASGLDHDAGLAVMLRYQQAVEGLDPSDPYTADEAEATWRSVTRNAPMEPARRNGSAPSRSAASSSPPPAPTVSERRTELGLARRFAAKFRGRVRYCHTRKFWLVWDGIRWVVDESGQVARYGREIIADVLAEALAAEDPEERAALAKFAVSCERARTIEAMLTLARSEPGIPVRQDDLDANQWTLNVVNGTLDLHAGVLHPHNAADLNTRFSPVVYDPNATCPRFDAFLGRVAPSPEVRDYLQRFLGSCLTGVCRDDVALFLHSIGAAGTTVLCEAVGSLLGDYAAAVSPEILLEAAQPSRATPEVMRLRGVRLALVSELPRDGVIAESRFKSLTGGDTVVARQVYQAEEQFRPTHKFVVRTNHKPVIRGTDDGIWRRIAIVPFGQQIPEAERVERDVLVASLLEESSGILNWLLAGCAEWQRRRLAMPDEIRTATAGYRSQSDLLGLFLDESIKHEAASTLSKRRVYETFHAWCERYGERPPSQRALSDELQRRGFVGARASGGLHVWRGIAFRPLPEGGVSDE